MLWKEMLGSIPTNIYHTIIPVVIIQNLIIIQYINVHLMMYGIIDIVKNCTNSNLNGKKKNCLLQ